MEKLISDSRKKLRSHQFIERYKLRKYLSGILSIYIDELYLEKKTNQFINDISAFNNEHTTQCYKETISNIPEELRYTFSMTPTGFINGQYE